MNVLSVLKKHGCQHLMLYKWCRSSGFDEDVSQQALVVIAHKLEDGSLKPEEVAPKLGAIASDLQEQKLEIKLAQQQKEQNLLEELLRTKKIKRRFWRRRK